MAPSTLLTDDILIEIFIYLPLNSIYKFKSLSKVWLSNLSNPNFISNWFQINYKYLPWIQYYLIFDHSVTGKNPLKFKFAYPDLHSEFMSRNEHLFSFKFLTNQEPFQGSQFLLLGSSNGLVLCYSFSLDYWKRTGYHVCNPITQKWVSLPAPPSLESITFDVSAIFCENSSLLASCYKVVQIPHFKHNRKKFEVDMFCSDLGVWESFEVSCDEDVVWGRWDKVVILNGVLFWVEGRKRLLIYNLIQKNKSHGNRCSLINLPDVELFDDENSYSDCNLRESERCVCYTRIRKRGMEMNVSVWVLEDVNWKILHNDIPIEEGILAEMHSRIGEVARIQVLGLSPIDRNIVFLGCKHWVWGINIKTRSLEELCLDNKLVYNAGRMFLPFVLTPMPTVLPPIDSKK